MTASIPLHSAIASVFRQVAYSLIFFRGHSHAIEKRIRDGERRQIASQFASAPRYDRFDTASQRPSPSTYHAKRERSWGATALLLFPKNLRFSGTPLNTPGSIRRQPRKVREVLGCYGVAPHPQKSAIFGDPARDPETMTFRGG